MNRTVTTSKRRQRPCTSACTSVVRASCLLVLLMLHGTAPVSANIHGHSITTLQTTTVRPSAFLGKRSGSNAKKGIHDLESLRLDLSGGATVSPDEEDIALADADNDAEPMLDETKTQVAEEGTVTGGITDVNLDVSVKEKIRGGATKVLAHEEQEEEELLSTSAAPEMLVSTLPVSKPIRISTNENGHEVVREEIVSKAMTRKERRLARKKQRGEEKSHRKYAKKLKNRNNLNIRRKVLHAGFGFVFATLNQVIPKKLFVPGMTILTSGTLVMELLRYRKGFGWMNDLLHFCLGGSLRKHEMEGKFTGSFYYFLGVTITAAMFPTSAASLGICQLALADPSASYFGRQTRHIYWSRIENGCFGIGRNKGVLGFLGGACFCFPFNYFVLSKSNYFGKATVDGISKVVPMAVPGKQAIALASIALGLAGAFADLCVPTPALTMPKEICGIPMAPFHVDDNVVVPIFSGYACTKIFEYLGWSSGVDLAKYIIF